MRGITTPQPARPFFHVGRHKFLLHLLQQDFCQAGRFVRVWRIGSSRTKGNKGPRLCVMTGGKGLNIEASSVTRDAAVHTNM